MHNPMASNILLVFRQYLDKQAQENIGYFGMNVEIFMPAMASDPTPAKLMRLFSEKSNFTEPDFNAFRTSDYHHNNNWGPVAFKIKENANPINFSINDFECLQWHHNTDVRFEWVPVKTWLDHMATCDHLSEECQWSVDIRLLYATISRGYDAEADRKRQIAWWDSLDTQFPLMLLSAELRELIYFYAIGPVIVPRTKMINTSQGQLKGVAVFGNGFHHKKGKPEMKYDFKTPDDPDIDPPNIALLLTCKQVHQEALQVGWEQTTVRFRPLHSESTTMTRGVAPLVRIMFQSIPYMILSSVQLAFDMKAYFEMLGFNPCPRTRSPWRRAVPLGPGFEALTKLDNLQYLDFRFSCPKHPETRDPWRTQGSCQRGTVDAFFTIGLARLRPLIQQLNKVSMSGAVKNSTRVKWEAIIEDEKNGKEHDMSTEVTALIGRPWHPFVCNCPVPCDPGLGMFNHPNVLEFRGVTYQPLAQVLDRVHKQLLDQVPEEDYFFCYD